MDKFTLSFTSRQLQVRLNSWLILKTCFGEIAVQYVACSECYGTDSYGCNTWSYTFCLQDVDLPSEIVSVCQITPDILEQPYLTPIQEIFLEDTETVDVQGNGTQGIPYNFNVIIDPDITNDLEERVDGLYASGSGSGTVGPAGPMGPSGSDGTNGADGSNGADGVDGADGVNGAGPIVGSVFYIAGNAAPLNTEPLLGQLLNRISYPELWSFASTSGNIIDDVVWLSDPAESGHFSFGDGMNTFRVPDVRGNFLRPWNSDNLTAPDPGRAIGTSQDDAIRNITGTAEVGTDLIGTTGAFSSGAATTSGATNDGTASNELSFDASTQVPTASENRPSNIAFLAVIQSKTI